jgi:hypothetical protein
VRIVLCESGLKSARGHHFNLAAALKEELAARGIPLALWANTALDDSLRRELGAAAVFDRSPYDASPWRSRGSQVGRFLLGAWSFRSALRRGGVRPDDVLLVPSARPAEILGVATALDSRMQPRAVVLNFMLDDFNPVLRTRNPLLVRSLYRLALGLVRARTDGGRLVLTCQSDTLARSVSAAGRVDVAVYPMIKSYPPRAARSAGDSPTIGFLGAPRSDKGERLLPSLIDCCARSLPASRIVVQLGDPTADVRTAGWPANVDVLPVGLDRGRYFKLVNEIDVVVLPYDVRTFGTMTSGVYAEAVACGCVAIVPAGTWMAEMLSSGRGAGLVVDDMTAEGIADAVMRAVADLERLELLAGEAVGPWRASQGVAAYVDRLLAELRDPV